MGHLQGIRRPEAQYLSPVVEGLEQRKKDLDIQYKADLAQNSRFGDEVGSVTKRSVIGRYNGTVETAAIVGAYRYYRPSTSTGYLLQVNSTTLRVGDDSAKTFSTMHTYSGTPTRMMALTYQDLCYVATDSTNASDNIMVTDGVTAWELGACKAVISSTTGQLDNAATYKYSIGYNTSADGSGTDTIQGALVTVTSGTTKGIDLTHIPLGDSSQLSRIIYRTAGGAATLEKVHILGDNTTTTWTDTAADGGTISAAADGGGGEVDLTTSAAHGLQVNDRVTIAGTTDYNGSFTVVGVADTTHFSITDTWVSDQSGTWTIGENMGTVTDDVPKGQYLYTAQERLFVTGDANYKSFVYYSDQYLPHWIMTSSADLSSTAASDYYDVISEDDGDVITGIASQLGNTYVFKQNNIYPYYVKGTPNTWTIGDTVSPIGSPAGYSIRSTEYGIIYQGWHHIYLFNGQHAQVVADEFTVDENIADARITKSFGYFWNNLYLLAYTDRNAGNDYHDKVSVYDLLRKQASIDTGGVQTSGSGNVNINCFTSFRGEAEWDQLYAGDSNLGWVYQYENSTVTTQINTISGLDAGTHKGTITATTIAFVDGGGGADTITDTGSAFLTSGFVAGQKIFVTGSATAANNKEMTIVSVVAGTITLATGIVTARVAGDTVTITSYQTDAIGTEVNPVLSRPEIDLMEYANDTDAQAAWVSSDGSEAYDANVLLLLHGEGDYDDESANDHTIANTNCTLDTTTYKFDTSSILFGGTAYLKAPDHADWDFGAGDFTLDVQVNFSSLGASPSIIMSRNTTGDSGGSEGWDFFADSGKLAFYVFTGDNYAFLLTAAYTFTPGVWYHVAMVRNGDNWRLFVNATQVGTTYTAANYLNGWSGTMSDYDYDLFIGCRQTSGGTELFLSGYMDEIRISGVARWTADFTAPTHAYGYNLQCYSEDTTVSTVSTSSHIPTSYALKIEAMKTNSLNDTLSKTITALNLSATAHDQILMDVYAFRSGTQFQIGIGETGGAFTDNLKNVAVTASNTWETVAIDFSSVADASKNAIIYLGAKITNADHDNVIYIDNIRTGFVGTATYTSPIYNINASGGLLDKLYWNEALNNKSSTYANDVKFYIRLGASSAACAATAWSAAYSTPSGTDISAVTANDYFQFKCELVGADGTEFLYFPYLYTAGGYLAKATYTQSASAAESTVTFRYSTGFRNFGAPINDKLYKKITSVHEGTAGTFDLIATTDLQDEQITTDNSPDAFNDISLTTYPKRWTSNFPSNMYGKELKLEWFKDDVEDFKVKQYGIIIENMPII